MSDTDQFRRVMSQFPTGVTVVTLPSDPPHGITVSAFASVSLDPPQVLVAIDHDTAAHDLLETAVEGYCVNILAADQEDLGRHFADIEHLEEDPFEQADTAGTGAPIFDGVLGYVDCITTTRVASGDHTLFVGEVDHHAVRNPDKPALTYFRSDWGQVQ